MLRQNEIQIRVRYQETDGQARVHHANYFTYFELARTEILRASGMSYRQVEEAGYHLVVAEIGCEYFLPANFDDLLTLRTTVVRVKGAGSNTGTKYFAMANCWPAVARWWRVLTGPAKCVDCRIGWFRLR